MKNWMGLIFFLLSFKIFYAENKVLKIPLNHTNQYYLFSFIVNNISLQSFFLPITTNSTTNILIVNSSINCVKEEKCYKPDKSKDQNREDRFKVFSYINQGKVYKDKFYLNGHDIGELDFLYVNKTGGDQFDSLFFFNLHFLSILKQRNIISKQIISYDDHGEILDVYFGKEYSIKNYKYNDYCDMVTGIYGCILKKMAVQKNKEIVYENFEEFKMNVEFYAAVKGEKGLFAPKNMIEKLLSFLKKQNFNCTNPYQDETFKGNRCYSKDNYGYFIFGEKGISFQNITLIEIKDCNHIYFSFDTIENLHVIIDVDNKKVVFHSDKENVVKSFKSSARIFLIILILLIIIILIIAIYYYFVVWKKRVPSIQLIEKYESLEY